MTPGRALHTVGAMKTTFLLLALVAVYASTATARPSSSWTLERYLTVESWHAFADVGSKNAGPDDIYASQQRLETPGGSVVGVVNGYGVNLHRPYVFFHWTASLRGGTLSIESAVDLRQKTAVYPIEGGTGRYAGARGTVTLVDEGSKGSLVTVRYRT
jgi:hypothetical protein